MTELEASFGNLNRLVNDVAARHLAPGKSGITAIFPVPDQVGFDLEAFIGGRSGDKTANVFPVPGEDALGVLGRLLSGHLRDTKYQVAEIKASIYGHFDLKTFADLLELPVTSSDHRFFEAWVEPAETAGGRFLYLVEKNSAEALTRTPEPLDTHSLAELRTILMDLALDRNLSGRDYASDCETSSHSLPPGCTLSHLLVQEDFRNILETIPFGCSVVIAAGNEHLELIV